MKTDKDLAAASSTPTVLAILAERDSHGYAVFERARALSGGRVTWTDGMLYPVLHRLERLGHVEPQWEVTESGRRRKYYRITPRGRARLAEDRRGWESVDATLGRTWSALRVPIPSSHPASAGPFFAAMLATFLATLLWTGRWAATERNVLTAFDLALVAIVVLLLYAVTARDPRSPPGASDALLVVLVVVALLADAVALWAIAARITQFGVAPNRVAALGESVILLVHLARSAVLYIGFLRGRGSFSRLQRWQTNCLPVYVAWAALVVIVFPLVFREM